MEKKSLKKKIILMGQTGAGKTSMRSIVFSSYIARDTRKLSATIDVEYTHIRFLGNLVIYLWDCGGQETFLNTYFNAQKGIIFRNVQTLVFLFDITSVDFESDILLYKECLKNLLDCSPDAHIFCLMHKMDLIEPQRQDEVYQEKLKHVLAVSPGTSVNFFRSSIYNESLYHCWSNIIYDLIPNSQIMDLNLAELSRTIGAEEAIIFEKSTLVIVSHYTEKPTQRDDKFERLSYIIKQFKRCCSKTRTNFIQMALNTRDVKLYFQEFTPNSYIMISLANTKHFDGICRLNIESASRHFVKLERSNGMTCSFDKDVDTIHDHNGSHV